MGSGPQDTGRDTAIDIIRGLGILMIGVDHLTYLAEKFGTPGFINPFLTWLRVGWSSAAEFFVFFSGYVVGMVYVRTLDSHGLLVTWARAAQRSWRVYALNILTFCCVLLLLHLGPFANPRLNELTHMDVFMGDSAAASIVAFLRMQNPPLFFEILRLYVLLLLAVPVLLLIARVSNLLLLLASLSIWLLAQINAATGIAPAFGGHGNFNPLGWQFLFVLGMLASIRGVFKTMAAAFSRRQLLAMSGTLLLVALVLKVADRSNIAWPLIGAFDMPGYDKVNLGPLQLLHFLISAVFVVQAVPRSNAVQQLAPWRALARVGSRSLECFCFSTVLVYAAVSYLSLRGALDPFSMLAAGTLIVLLLCAFAPLMDWLDAKPWRSQAKRKSAQPFDPVRQLSGETP